MHYFAFLSGGLFSIGGLPIQGALSGSWAEQLLYRRPADTSLMLLPYKSWCICIDGPPIQNSPLNDSNCWTVVSVARRYQGSVVIFHFHHFHHISFPIFHFGIGGPPIPGKCRHISFPSFPSYFISNISFWYQRYADTREVLSYFISIISIIFHFQYFTLVSAGRDTKEVSSSNS